MKTLDKISQTVKDVVNLKKEFDKERLNPVPNFQKIEELKNRYQELRNRIEHDEVLNEHMVLPKELHHVELWSRFHL